MGKRHGWTNASNMTSRYVHLVDSDVEDKILSYYGLKKKDENSDKNYLKICTICKMPNSSEFNTCTQCGKLLDLETALDMEEKEKLLNEKLEQKLENFEKQLPEIVGEIILRSKNNLQKFGWQSNKK